MSEVVFELYFVDEIPEEVNQVLSFDLISPFVTLIQHLKRFCFIWFFEHFSNVINPSINIVALAKNDSVVIRVCDNGPGFSPQVLAHRFESPITELKVNGQGIGLFSTYKAILRWSGKFNIDNDHGAVVELTLISAASANISLITAQNDL